MKPTYMERADVRDIGRGERADDDIVLRRKGHWKVAQRLALLFMNIRRRILWIEVCRMLRYLKRLSVLGCGAM